MKGTWVGGTHIAITLIFAFILARVAFQILHNKLGAIIVSLLLCKVILGDWDVEKWAWTPIDVAYWVCLTSVAVLAVTY